MLTFSDIVVTKRINGVNMYTYVDAAHPHAANMCNAEYKMQPATVQCYPADLCAARESIHFTVGADTAGMKALCSSSQASSIHRIRVCKALQPSLYAPTATVSST